MAMLSVGPVSQVCFDGGCFKVELAVTAEAQRKGLMFRESLDADAGMLFIYEETSLPVMYMKNTLIPLDLIWLNRKKEVVQIQSRAPICQAEPCPRYYPSEPSRYVLEIRAGRAEQIGLRIGDRARFS